MFFIVLDIRLIKRTYPLVISKYIKNRSVCLIDKCVRSIGLPEPMLFFTLLCSMLEILSVNLADNKERI
ncbi:hypothetical protein E5355_13730 [Bacteroides muris (ex Afrizal et al. 2022)]|uniref:Uncharacterized protein n=1 Tax=Bacteroides muris (ex Afrizal et al. 2022) TaxID=2516960 RepID=A0A4S2AMP2_9BACE|nr:hypothetical protein E5355_13730 [Bacteroides muris (ex Afrizal et al. 2022)]